jgi:hypothetical protein
LRRFEQSADVLPFVWVQGHQVSVCSVLSGSIHARPCFLPMSRFPSAEIDQEIAAMERLLQEAPTRSSWYLLVAIALFIGFISYRHLDPKLDAYIGHNTPRESPRLAKTTPPSEFRRYLSQGIPVVVTSLHAHLQGNWAPEYFIQRYGTQKVTLVDCETDCTQQSTVSDFFRHLDGAGERKHILKLKVMYICLTVFSVFIFCRIGLLNLTFVLSFRNYSMHSNILFHSEMLRA